MFIISFSITSRSVLFYYNNLETHGRFNQYIEILKYLLLNQIDFSILICWNLFQLSSQIQPELGKCDNLRLTLGFQSPRKKIFKPISHTHSHNIWLISFAQERSQTDISPPYISSSLFFWCILNHVYIYNQKCYTSFTIFITEKWGFRRAHPNTISSKNFKPYTATFENW